MSSNDKVQSQKVFTRRAFMIGAMQTGLLTVMGGRLAYLQIVEGKRYQMLSDKNRIHTKILAPSRGEIVDRFGQPLAVNAPNFRVMITPEQAKDVEKILKRLGGVIDLESLDIERALDQASKVPKFVSVEVKDDLAWEDVSKIEVNLPDLPGLRIDAGERRSYPQGIASAHLIGYVGAVNQKEIGDAPVLSVPNFKVGRTGIERSYDTVLRGHAGTSEVEVNVVGREVRELSRTPEQDGKKLVLSVDSDLQNVVQERLERERSAAAVIMDVHDGGVYALASSPGFDPNLFTKPLLPDTWETMLANPGHPLTNKAVAGQYPPGSTFKMVTALAILEAGIANRYSKVYCPGHYEYGSDRFHCWKGAGHGEMNLVSALAESCDVYFYKLATEVGIEKIAEMARKLGLGQKYNFGLVEEHAGLVPDKTWKMGYFGKSWRPGETIVTSIGQGSLLSTPLQLAVMTSRLVNGGRAVLPWLCKDMDEYFATEYQTLGFKKKNLDLIRKGMEEVVNGKHGTAGGARIFEAGMEMGGKTGTAQVKRITMKQRLAGVKNEDLPWKHRHHALFVGYAPYGDPRYACAVVVEHGVSGSRTAAPLARDLLLEVQKRAPAGKGHYSADARSSAAVQNKKA